MLFPKEKMHVTTSYEGRTSEDGWLVLDFSKIDTEGIGRIYISLEDVHKLQQQKNQQVDILKKTRDLLSLEDES